MPLGSHLAMKKGGAKGESLDMKSGGKKAWNTRVCNGFGKAVKRKRFAVFSALFLSS
jgi:hypothetical protein